MARKIFANLATLGVIVLSICTVKCKSLNSNEAQAKSFLKETSDKMFTFFDELVNKENYYEIDIYLNQYKTNRNYIKFVNKIVEDARTFDFENFEDTELKYAFEILIQLADENIIGVNRQSRIFESLKGLDYLTSYEEILKYQNTKEKLPYSPDVLKIIEKSMDEKELQHYWTAWRKLTGEWANDNLNFTIEGLKDAANMSDLSAVKFWSRGFNITDMEDLMWEIQPLYKELHALIRNLLRNRFGAPVIGSNGLIPDHLFEQIKHQIMTNDSLIEELYHFEDLPSTDQMIDESFNANEFYKIANRFFRKLGFKKYPSKLWGDRIKLFKIEDEYAEKDDGEVDEYDDEGAENCRTRVNYRTPNVYLEYCPGKNLSNFFDSFINLGYLYYAKEMKGLPAYYFKAPQSLDYAIGKAMILSASTHQFLNDNGLLFDLYSTKKIEMNRLLRMGLRHLLYLPLDFIHTKLMADLLSDKVKLEDINNYYWDLMSEYAGIKKPNGHETDNYDLPYNFYKQMNSNQMGREFTTEILSFQIQKKLCELSGKYPDEPLHECNIAENKDAGDALKEMMQLGSAKPFYEVLEAMFPENPKVSSEGFLEYFKPLQIMLRKKNKKSNLKSGWSSSVAY
ncbi:angiotensin-converting enzyme-like [Episyrphus balteatus]|uniref:angiotensin-converting enzyme-like n=1 Tax=Episyrphus balteatus TaxID=286459 RepID=UPI00248691DE|nr:angiotensin-converting enzyme-like [Episyrphus balteatus]